MTAEATPTPTAGPAPGRIRWEPSRLRSSGGHDGYVGELKTRVFSTGWNGGKDPAKLYYLQCNLPGFTNHRYAATEAAAQQLAERILVRFAALVGATLEPAAGPDAGKTPETPTPQP